MHVLSSLKMLNMPVPPLHQWPKFAKKIVFTLAVLICAVFYLLLASGLISLLVLGVNLLAS